MITLNDIKIISEDAKSYYKILHSYPELGFEEYKTSDFIVSKLEEFNLEIIKNVAKTGVIGVIRGGKVNKTLMLRADIDGLSLTEESGLEYASKNEGRMHACGHDAHVAMLLGAAKYLSENRHLVKGNVKFVFQPAEEGPSPGGASVMIKEGVLNDVSACLAIHVSPLYKTGEVMVQKKEAMASTDFFKVEIIGKGGHGSAPHSAIDPIPALTEIMAAFNLLPSREIDPFDPCVVTIGTVNTISSSWNTIPEKIEITGTFRSFSVEVRETINKRLKEISEKISLAHRCIAVYTRKKGYMPTINDEKLAKFIFSIAKSYIPEKKVFFTTKPFTAGEDLGAYFQKVPGVLIWIGCADPNEESPVFLHNPNFKVFLETLAVGVQVHINNVLSFFESKHI